MKAAGELRGSTACWSAIAASCILERYFNGRRATTPANIKSASKSVISALVGIAADRQSDRSRDSPSDAIFPISCGRRRRGEARDHDRRPADDAVGARVDEQSQLRRVGAEPELGAARAREAAAGAPGHRDDLQHRQHAPAVGDSCRRRPARARGSSRRRRWPKPLGFTLAQWPRDPQGIYFGGNDMLMTPRQMLAFGELYLNGGRVGGRQIVPEAFVDGVVRAARALAHQRPRVRLRLVDARDGRPSGVLRLGLRRPVHRARAEPRPRRRLDVGRDGERRPA